MKCSTFWSQFIRITSATGELVPPTPHREQARYLAWVDAALVAPPGTTRESLLHWGKKSAKSSTAAARALHHLVAQPDEPEDRLIGIASFDEEQSAIIFGLVRQFVARHQWLAENIKLLRNEAIFEEAVRDPRTGGQYTRTHRLRVLARDARGTHGEPWSLVIRDELWSEPDHSMSEALIPSPTRRRAEVLYLSYSGLASQQKAGVPLFDLLTRAKAGDDGLFYSYIGGTGDDASWRVCPWITEAWVEGQRRLFAASPSRFKRVVLNLPVTADGDTLLTPMEMAGITVRTTPRLVGPRLAGLDLGLTNDHAALVWGALDPDGIFVVEGTEIWTPPDEGRISLQAVEDRVVRLAREVTLARVCVDQWQAAQLVERLVRAGVPARMVGVEQTRLDKMVTTIKSAAASRTLQVPSTCVYLLEQLESVRTVETRTPRRDLLKFAASGTGPSASAHDDAVVALGLCLIEVAPKLGRVALAEMPSGCRLAFSRPGAGERCYLAGGTVPAEDPICHAHCEGHQSAVAAFERYLARGGEPIDLRTFAGSGHLAPNTWLLNIGVQRVANLLMW